MTLTPIKTFLKIDTCVFRLTALALCLRTTWAVWLWGVEEYAVAFLLSVSLCFFLVDYVLQLCYDS